MKILAAAILLTSIFSIIGCTGCDDKNPKAGGKKEDDSSDTTPSETVAKDGLSIVDVKVGTGLEAKNGKTVVVHYTGTLMDGKKFDSSRDRGRPYEFVLGTGAVIQGWDKGVLGMKIGGFRKLVIPPELAYGSRGAGGVIPPDATIKFEVELLGVK